MTHCFGLSALCATGAVTHALDNGDGPPSLHVKPCSPEFYQTHYQLVSCAKQQEKGSWGIRQNKTIFQGICTLVCIGISCFALFSVVGVERDTQFLPYHGLIGPSSLGL